jgi:hypothetical protein
LPKNIAIISNTLWSIYNFRIPLIQTLDNIGYTVFIIAPKDDYHRHCASLKRAVYIPLECLAAKSLNPYRDIKLAYELIKIFKCNKIEYI